MLRRDHKRAYDLYKRIISILTTYNYFKYLIKNIDNEENLIKKNIGFRFIQPRN